MSGFNVMPHLAGVVIERVTPVGGVFEIGHGSREYGVVSGLR